MQVFDWRRIRAFNNSQNNAFEELVCQLASEEPVPNKKSFRRVAAPDGGVECYCELADGSEFGWQAKYFFTLGRSQWEQIENSFERALATHPKLSTYYVAAPIDLQDPRDTERHSVNDVWNEKTKEWKKFAKRRSREVDFVYWGSHEMLLRLSKPEHAGRLRFWFNAEQFTDEWFADRLSASIDSLGNRYSDELNVELGIARLFDAMARTERFRNVLRNHLVEIKEKGDNFIRRLEKRNLGRLRSETEEYLRKVTGKLDPTDLSECEPIDVASLKNLSSKFLDGLDSHRKEIYLSKRQLSENAKSNVNGDEKENYRQESDDLDELSESILDLGGLLESNLPILANNPILIVTGKAGVGKSHLLADAAKHMQQIGHMSILLLGQKLITEEEPWTQILKNVLRLEGSEDDFLGALDSRAEASHSRILVFIDAINEGRGKLIWPNTIKAFIKTFKKYRWLGLVLSVRSSYEDIILPKEIIPADLALRVNHEGFAGVENAATKKFFEYYGIETPSVPLLHPEYQNPLFLKLFCEGLKKSGLTRPPEGYEGVTKIFEYYLSAVNNKLARPDQLDYSNSLDLVGRCVYLIANEVRVSSEKWVPYEKAFDLLESELRKINPSRNNFLEQLISEGVFSKDMFWIDTKKTKEGVYFTYERFGDMRVADLTVKQFLGPEIWMRRQINAKKISPLTALLESCLRASCRLKFSLIKRLSTLAADEESALMNSGMIEAFSIILPEAVGFEFYELCPRTRDYDTVVNAFIESLIWRKVETVSHRVLSYINNFISEGERTEDHFLEMLLLIASNPRHPFNAEFLHKHLSRFTLADRDAWWTIYINSNFDEESIIARIVDWAWLPENVSNASSDSLRLIGIVLAWFFTSSNRYLRDSATKAMVCLLHERLDIMEAILRQFEGVNDPYVYERLFAVAYGTTLRSVKLDGLKNLSKYIYETVFLKEKIYPHVLLRDYARGVIEIALREGISLDIDAVRIRPPFKSDFPTVFPTNEDIKKYEFEHDSEDFKDHFWSQNAIVYSMVTEYGRGVARYGDFGRYIFQSAFRQWNKLDPQGLSNVALKRIFELGYDVEKHGYYDRGIDHRQSYVGRSGRKIERIGKKYQWIAFYELLAQVSDKFQMQDDSSWRVEKLIDFQGPWEPYVRDIDPSITVKKTLSERYEKHSRRWWFGCQYNAWDDEATKWLKDTKTIPECRNLIEVQDPEGVAWLVLEIHPEWQSPPAGREDSPQKIVWCQLRSYLAKSKDFNKIKTSLNHVNFMGRWMPESRDSLYEVFYREMYWSPAYDSFASHYYRGDDWHDVTPPGKRANGKVMVTTENFLWGEEYDCSKDEAIRFMMLNKPVFNGMNLRLGSFEGEVVDRSRRIMAFDPSVRTRSISCLLVRKREFFDYLKKNNLEVFWAMLGEKQVYREGAHNVQPKVYVEMSGLYYFDGGILKGKTKPRLVRITIPKKKPLSKKQQMQEQLLSKLAKKIMADGYKKLQNGAKTEV
ncbi:MAG TPA: ATP-binding protein [Candidatus Kryptonia bacterium]